MNAFFFLSMSHVIMRWSLYVYVLNINEWGVSHIWRIHGTRVNEWVVSHTWMVHGTLVKYFISNTQSIKARPQSHTKQSHSKNTDLWESCNTLQHTVTHCNTLQHTATITLHIMYTFNPKIPNFSAALTGKNFFLEQDCRFEDQGAPMQVQKSLNSGGVESSWRRILRVLGFLFDIFFVRIFNSWTEGTPHWNSCIWTAEITASVPGSARGFSFFWVYVYAYVYTYMCPYIYTCICTYSHVYVDV